jgi:threonine dehydrogenase-like Zn-dependent dehydrogenase
MTHTETEAISVPNQALTFVELGKIEIRSNPLKLPKDETGQPLPPDGCVLVRVRVTGICGSDVSNISSYFNF